MHHNPLWIALPPPPVSLFCYENFSFDPHLMMSKWPHMHPLRQRSYRKPLVWFRPVILTEVEVVAVHCGYSDVPISDWKAAAVGCSRRPRQLWMRLSLPHKTKAPLLLRHSLIKSGGECWWMLTQHWLTMDRDCVCKRERKCRPVTRTQLCPLVNLPTKQIVFFLSLIRCFRFNCVLDGKKNYWNF